MDFDLSTEQQMLADSVDRFGRELYDSANWRRMVAAGSPFDRGYWRRMAELGWLALTVPEAGGGYGGDAVDTMVIAQAMGRHLMLEPFVSTCVAAAPLLVGHPEACQRIMEGELIVALAVGEGHGRYDLAWVGTEAVREGDGYLLNGVKSHAPDGGVADAYIVPARLSGEIDDRSGIGLFLVGAGADRLTVSRSRAPDQSRNAALSLRDVRVPFSALLVGPEDGLDALELSIDRAIAARLSEALGAMDALAEMTLQYLRTRKQFGVPIGSFQVLQHKMVDMAIACEEARSLVYAATLSLTQPARERQIVVSAAKARVGQLALETGRMAVQLHGGIGASDELMVGHYLKRLMMIDQTYGNADYHLARFARLSDSGNQPEAAAA
jgi:alkylation response protein AidB-like acyl-CoA dehydrogenase